MQMDSFKENGNLVTVLRTTQRKQSKMTEMFEETLIILLGAWHLHPFLPGENPWFLMESRAPCLLEKLKEPDLLSASPWQPLFRCVTCHHQSDAPSRDLETQRVTRT